MPSVFQNLSIIGAVLQRNYDVKTNFLQPIKLNNNFLKLLFLYL